jgi:hypothetical protein
MDGDVGELLSRGVPGTYSPSRCGLERPLTGLQLITTRRRCVPYTRHPIFRSTCHSVARPSNPANARSWDVTGTHQKRYNGSQGQQGPCADNSRVHLRRGVGFPESQLSANSDETRNKVCTCDQVQNNGLIPPEDIQATKAL